MRHVEDKNDPTSNYSLIIASLEHGSDLTLLKKHLKQKIMAAEKVTYRANSFIDNLHTQMNYSGRMNCVFWVSRPALPANLPREMREQVKSLKTRYGVK